MDLENLFALMNSKGFHNFSGSVLENKFRIFFKTGDNVKDCTMELTTLDHITWDLQIFQSIFNIDYVNKSGQEIFEIIEKWE